MGMPFPEEYGGAGGDTLAYAIAVEELTRIDSSVAITVAAHTRSARCRSTTSATRSRSASGCPELASGREARRVRPDRAGRRLRRGRDAHDRRAARRAVGRQRLEDVHHERRHGHHRVRDDHGASPATDEISNLDRPERHARLRDLGADAEARLARLRHARAVVQGLSPCPRATCSGRAARASSSSSRSSTAAASRSRRWASASRRARTTSPTRTRRSASSSASRSRSSRRSSSSSPTWRRRSRPAARSSTRPRG